jgi:hypothetical protein
MVAVDGQGQCNLTDRGPEASMTEARVADFGQLSAHVWRTTSS